MSKKKKKVQILKRPVRFILRFSKTELREFFAKAKWAGMSKNAYAIRKILERPVAEESSVKPAAPAETAAHV